MLRKIVIIILYATLSFGQNEQSNNCKADELCKPIKDCPSVINNLAKGRSFPSNNVCGYEETHIKVCCANNREQSATTELSPGSRAKQKCKEFSRYAYENITGSNDTINNVLDCHIGGNQLTIPEPSVSRKEFPHMVEIGYIKENSTKWLCEGSLISKKFVLTVAHCIRSLPKLVRGGLTHRNDTNTLQTRNILKLFIYPDFNYTRPYHDIGLIELDNSFDLNTFLRPACLYTENKLPNTRANGSSWAKEFNFEDGPTDMIKVGYDILNISICNGFYERFNGINEDIMICSKVENEDVCSTSGSPLQVIHKNTEDVRCMYEIVGIRSFGACGRSHVPSVFTKVSHYISWIEDIVWPNK